jgi:cholesterol oxidase
VVPIPARSGGTPSLSFSEHQHGFFAPLDEADNGAAVADTTIGTDRYWSGYELGIDLGSPLDFTVHIGYEDLTAALANPRLPEAMTGTVMAAALSRQALTITHGSFVLLEPDPTQVETSHMTYSMDVRSVEGKEYEIFGFKVLHEGPEWAAWTDSTTLFVTIRERRGSSRGSVIGRGITEVSAGDFVDLLRSMHVSNVPSLSNQLGYKLRFGRVLGRSLFEHYGGSFDEIGRFPTLPPLTEIPQPRNWKGDPVTFLRSVDDGWFSYSGGSMKNACSRLIGYRGPQQSLGPVILAPGFGMPAWSLTTHTIEVNLVEFLIGAGYEVWLFDYHSGSDLPSANTEFTLDNVAEDWTMAIEKVLVETGRDSVQCVGHCVGSAGLLMAVLKGAKGVRSMVCGQYTLFPYTSTLNLIKNYLDVGGILAAVGVTEVSPDTALSPKNVALDLALRPIPIPAGERCGLSVCRWINAIYGLTHTHSQFNNATHDELGDIFGIGDLLAIRQIGRTMVRRRLVDANGGDTYLTPDNVKNLNIPIHFCAGMLNYIFRPKGTRVTVEFLSEQNPTLAQKGYYTASYLPAYAHLDTMIGRNSARDVYPLIVDQLDRHQ